ncbi:hypothetical protein TREES_T100011991 [Tupaia chinensis]|uniref:Uncharacterized protein n=1 Tax=Tupaia chinensis TaxID=246437 RepID=L9KNF7_TUPCH|nr:hypothetical protein TREES_T100011991 [Tupaia chinensis]
MSQEVPDAGPSALQPRRLHGLNVLTLKPVLSRCKRTRTGILRQEPDAALPTRPATLTSPPQPKAAGWCPLICQHSRTHALSGYASSTQCVPSSLREGGSKHGHWSSLYGSKAAAAQERHRQNGPGVAVTPLRGSSGPASPR